ncbi:VTT domain-containing protein [Dactylosporangium aurantiacum]|uniref:VTT domain-containing protein n=1 Tax=Dactylosporangium aurantiacum TaxID=35754 RepID=A0A9Q9IGM1_9ACTN|nr:VTT domain-containing protein [Dactylosporangium aurantiacum]MDG6107513.1 VTT domain-containing protein [Dactylosporangium aurantiacum]UWZ54303.1 VTT domain-containing protein [Dactylosporangium aurantiacum]
MTEWLEPLYSLPAALLGLALGLVMLLDSIPLLGILIPADVAILTTAGATDPFSSLGWIVAGCLAGWSLSFLAGRAFGQRLREGRFGRWIGEARWAKADHVVRTGGSRILVTAPFLPLLNTLVPLAAGGLRMPYLRFLRSAALGSVLWGGLYVGLGVLATRLSGLLPTGDLTTVATVGLGLTFGWVALFTTRRVATVRS